MPGYLVHFASCFPTSLKQPDFRIGVEAPDLLSFYYKHYGLEGARKKWEKLLVPGVPHFDRFASRLKDIPLRGLAYGLHYGPSSSPEVRTFWSSLSESEQDSAFWKGYLWHLFTDKVFYQRLNIETLLSVHISSASNVKEAMKREIEILHHDWDTTNSLIQKLYPISLPPEVKELDVVHFSDSSDTKYISKFILLTTIEYLRAFDPLSNDIMDTIQLILNS